LLSSTSRVLRPPPVETVETKRRPVPASAVPDWPDVLQDTMRVMKLCAVARCFSMSASAMVGQASVHVSSEWIAADPAKRR
jgi:hypothetical protein